jgi:alkane 1-monooxygenase
MIKNMSVLFPRNILYVSSLTPAIAVIFGNLHGGIFTLSNFFLSLIVFAFIEWLTPPIKQNAQGATADFFPQVVLYLHLLFQTAALLSLFYGIHMGIIQGWWIIASAISTGLNSGSSAVVVAHEFIHRKHPFQQWCGRYLLFTAGNMYFFVEHLRVHHKWVGTAKDHASANRGETLYGFFVRSVYGQFKGAFKMEVQRLTKQNRYSYSIYNYLLRQVLLQICLLFVLFYIGGLLVVSAYVLQCIFANFMLEYVNYIQHYGLNRPEKSRVTEHHSWDSNQFISRFVLVDLARHADHHYYASKPYHTLLNYEHSPKLPSGYAGLFFVVAVPPLWFRIIHPMLDKHLIASQHTHTPQSPTNPKIHHLADSHV